MAEAHATGLRELGTILLEPALELGRFRLARSGHVLGEELQLLRHAALHDGVVLVQSHRQRLTVKDFFLHPVFHQLVELFRPRLAPPLRLEYQGQLGKVVERQLDLLRRRRRPASRLHVVVHARTARRR